MCCACGTRARIGSDTLQRLFGNLQVDISKEVNWNLTQYCSLK